MRAKKIATATKSVRLYTATAPTVGQTLIATDTSGDEIVAAWGNPGAITTTAVALTDNSGGAAADGTIGAVTAPTAIGATLTDSTGQAGGHDDTLAATTVPTITATDPTAPTAYSAVVNMSDPVAKAEGEAVSAALATLRSEVATYETAISALVVDVAAILSLLTVMTQNASDTAQKVIELVAAQAQDRTAIVALTDAIKEITTQYNQLRADVAS